MVHSVLLTVHCQRGQETLVCKLWPMGLLTLKYSRVNVIAASSLKAETEPPISRPINEEIKCLILGKF